VNFGPHTKVIDRHVDPPKLNFSTDYISALTGCWLLKFLNALQIDQVLLAHTPNGDGGFPKIFKGERQIGLKIQGVQAYNFAASGSNVTTKFFHATCREAGVFKIWEGIKRLKFSAVSDNFRV